MQKGIIGGMVFLVCFVWYAQPLPAEEVFELTIKNHEFIPSRLVVPSHEKIKLIVKNEDASAEEFESHDLNREKIVLGKKEAVLFLGPLKPGEYKYFGEFHADTAKGVIVAFENTQSKEE